MPQHFFRIPHYKNRLKDKIIPTYTFFPYNKDISIIRITVVGRLSVDYYFLYTNPT